MALEHDPEKWKPVFEKIMLQRIIQPQIRAMSSAMADAGVDEPSVAARRLNPGPSKLEEVVLRFASAARLSAFAIILGMGVGSAAGAEDAVAPAAAPQQAPPDQSVLPATPQNPLPDAAAPSDASQNPVPDAGITGQADCIDETGDYVTHGNAVSYVIGLENKCGKRLSCKIYAYVVGARGPASGQTTLVLGAKSSGAAAKKTYTIKVKAAGGTAQVSRECRVF